MVGIPVSDVVRQVRLQWRLDEARAERVVQSTLASLGIRPRRRLMGKPQISGEEYRLLVNWLNERGLPPG